MARNKIRKNVEKGGIGGLITVFSAWAGQEIENRLGIPSEAGTAAVAFALFAGVNFLKRIIQR